MSQTLSESSISLMSVPLWEIHGLRVYLGWVQIVEVVPQTLRTCRRGSGKNGGGLHLSLVKCNFILFLFAVVKDQRSVPAAKLPIPGMVKYL